MQPVKRFLQALLPGALILTCGATGLQARRPPEPPVIAVDAAGKEIGAVLKMDFSLQRMQVALEINETLVPILVGKDAFSHGARPIAYFLSDDCTGAAHLGSSPESTLGPPAGVAGPRATVYWGYPETTQLRSIGSALFGGECREFEGTILVMNAQPLLDLADEFTPPFGIAPGDRPGGSDRGSRRAPGGERQ